MSVLLLGYFKKIFYIYVIQIAASIPNVGSEKEAEVHTAYVYMAMNLLSKETATLLDARLKVILNKVTTKTMVKVSRVGAVISINAYYCPYPLPYY